MVFCPVCARGALLPIVELIRAQCAVESFIREHKAGPAHGLLMAIGSLASTPPGQEEAVMRILGSAFVTLDGYIADIMDRTGGHA